MATSKREKELARQRAERQAARRAAAAARAKQRNAIIASILAISLVAAGLVAFALTMRDDSGGTDTVASDQGTSAPAESTPASAAPSQAPSAGATAPAPADKPPAGEVTCTYEKTGEPAAKEVELPPTEGVETQQVFDVTLATNLGDIVFEMDSSKAPCTANNLRSLAHFTYFDDTPCHRLTTEGIQVLQCGDPTGTGSGGPGYQFADENLEGATYPRGTVAMANAGAGTNGSQFFLVYGDSTLPPNYTPFGRITKGLEIIDQVAKAGSDGSNGAGDGKPKTEIVIKTLRAKPQPA